MQHGLADRGHQRQHHSAHDLAACRPGQLGLGPVQLCLVLRAVAVLVRLGLRPEVLYRVIQHVEVLEALRLVHRHGLCQLVVAPQDMRPLHHAVLRLRALKAVLVHLRHGFVIGVRPALQVLSLLLDRVLACDPDLPHCRLVHAGDRRVQPAARPVDLVVLRVRVHGLDVGACALPVRARVLVHDLLVKAPGAAQRPHQRPPADGRRGCRITRRLLDDHAQVRAQRRRGRLAAYLVQQAAVRPDARLLKVLHHALDIFVLLVPEHPPQRRLGAVLVSRQARVEHFVEIGHRYQHPRVEARPVDGPVHHAVQVLQHHGVARVLPEFREAHVFDSVIRHQALKIRRQIVAVAPDREVVLHREPMPAVQLHAHVVQDRSDVCLHILPRLAPCLFVLGHARRDLPHIVRAQLHALSPVPRLSDLALLHQLIVRHGHSVLHAVHVLLAQAVQVDGRPGALCDLECPVPAACDPCVDDLRVLALEFFEQLRVLPGHQRLKALGHLHLDPVHIALSPDQRLPAPVHRVVGPVSGQLVEFAFRVQVLRRKALQALRDAAGRLRLMRVECLCHAVRLDQRVRLPVLADDPGRVLDLVQRLRQRVAHVLQLLALQLVDGLVLQDITGFLHLVDEALVVCVPHKAVAHVLPHLPRRPHPALAGLCRLALVAVHHGFHQIQQLPHPVQRHIRRVARLLQHPPHLHLGLADVLPRLDRLGPLRRPGVHPRPVFLHRGLLLRRVLLFELVYHVLKVCCPVILHLDRVIQLLVLLLSLVQLLAQFQRLGLRLAQLLARGLLACAVCRLLRVLQLAHFPEQHGLLLLQLRHAPGHPGQRLPRLLRLRVRSRLGRRVILC